MQFEISRIASHFDGFRVAVVVARELVIETRRPPELEAVIAAREAEARERWRGKGLSQTLVCLRSARAIAIA